MKSEIKLENLSATSLLPWDPADSADGTCEWTLSGLRHDGKIVVSGPMVLKRISKDAQLILK